jgi:hypothetical protein
VDPVEIVKRRMRAQRLVGEPYAGPAEAVAALGAVQSQEYEEARWALAQRCGHPAAEAVESVLDAGEVLRTHVMRPTWHFVRREDVRWLLGLTAERLAAGDRSRLRQLELDGRAIERAGEIVERALGAGEPLARSELRAAMAEAGIEANASQIGHISFHLELAARICSGPRRGRDHTYVRFGPRARGARRLARDEALGELTRRYFTTHGPATVADYAWWAGLTLTDARRGVELSGLDLEELDGPGKGPYLDVRRGVRGAPVRGALMLSSFDELTVAYRDLRTVSPAGEPSRTLPLRPILVAGRLVGSWKRALGPETVRVEAALTESLDGAGERALAAEAGRFAAHLGREAELEIREGRPVAAA